MVHEISSTLDFWSAYQQFRIYPPYIPKTVFVTPFGHFEYLVVPCALTNSFSTFQTLIKSLMRHLPFVSVYLDDSLMLHARLAKCRFYHKSVDFLGQIIYDGVRPYPDKIVAVKIWPVRKREDATVVPGICEFLPIFHPSFSSNCSAFDKGVNKKRCFCDWKPE
jgi:hypothetical protein